MGHQKCIPCCGTVPARAESEVKGHWSLLRQNDLGTLKWREMCPELQNQDQAAVVS